MVQRGSGMQIAVTIGTQAKAAMIGRTNDRGRRLGTTANHGEASQDLSASSARAEAIWQRIAHRKVEAKEEHELKEVNCVYSCRHVLSVFSS